jgi:hypothetical protein
MRRIQNCDCSEEAYEQGFEDGLHSKNEEIITSSIEQILSHTQTFRQLDGHFVTFDGINWGFGNTEAESKLDYLLRSNLKIL